MVSQILSTTFEYHGSTGVRANPVIEDTPDRANFSQKVLCYNLKDIMIYT